MKKFQVFIVDDDRTDGGTVHVDNGVVMSNAQRKPLPNNPDGWQDIAIGWERNLSLYGVVRNFSLALGFVLDAAKILRKTFYTENIERKISLLITMLTLSLTDINFAFNYYFLYKGDLDLSTFQDEANKVTMNIMEGGISKLLKANSATLYDTPFLNDPDKISVYCTGINLVQNAQYYVSNGLILGFNNRQHTLNLLLLSTEEYQKFNATSTDRIQFTTNAELYASTQHFLTTENNSISTVVTIHYDFGFTCSLATGISPNPAAGGLLLIRQFDASGTATAGFPIASYGGASNMYQHHRLTGSATFTAAPNSQLFLCMFLTIGGVIATGSGADGEVFWEYDNELTDLITVDYTFTFKATNVEMWKLKDFFPKITGAVTGNKSDAVSVLLEAHPNICITCGDAIRGFLSAKIQTKMDDFFKSVNVQFNAGMGIEGNKLTLENKAHYFDPSGPIPLGEVKSLKVTLASDLMFNTLKIGSAPQDYEDINGRQEFNNTNLYGTPITRVVKELDLTSPYRRDSYGFEFTRINFAGKLTTDTASDNDIWLVNVTTNVPYNYLIYNGSFTATAPDTITIPIPFLDVSFLITITGAAANNGTFNVTSVNKLVAGVTIITVAEPIVTSTGTGIIHTGGIAPYALKRGVYDSITGLLTPDTVFNIEEMTNDRLIKDAHANWIHSLMWGFENSVMPFLTTDKNRELKTVQGTKIYDEDADIIIKDLAPPLFIPIYFEIETKVPVNLPTLLENNPAKCFSFTWEGTLYKGFLMKAGISISDNAAQVFKLLSTPDNDLSKLVV